MTSIERRIELVETEQRARSAARSSESSSPQVGSLVVATGTYQIVGVRKQATGTQRITVQGTGRLRIMN